MAIIIYAIILVLLLVVYYYSKKGTTPEVFVQCVEAGPVAEVDAGELRSLSYYDKDTVIRGLNGEELCSSDYARLLVKGICMSERGIKDGDMLVAEKAKRGQDFHQDLKSDNILWLHIEDTDMDKIRIFDCWEGEEMKTYYYKDGKKKPSSTKHKISQIKGIVRYKI